MARFSLCNWERDFREWSPSLSLSLSLPDFVLVVAAESTNCRPGIEADQRKGRRHLLQGFPPTVTMSSNTVLPYTENCLPAPGVCAPPPPPEQARVIDQTQNSSSKSYWSCKISLAEGLDGIFSSRRECFGEVDKIYLLINIVKNVDLMVVLSPACYFSSTLPFNYCAILLGLRTCVIYAN